MSVLRTNKIYPRDGLPAGASGGGIIQIVHSQRTTESGSTTSTTYTDTGLSVSITPQSASNKILIQGDLPVFKGNEDGAIKIRLLRDSTTIYEDTNYLADQATLNILVHGALLYIDSPATTSAITYKVQYAARDSGEDVNFGYNGAPSALVAMEISG